MAKKDLEDEVVSLQFDEADKWGGEIELRDGSRYFVEPFAGRPKLPVTVQAERLGPADPLTEGNIDGPRTFTRVALRIGMAARALPGVSVGRLLNGLVGNSAGRSHEDLLNRLTVTQLRNVSVREVDRRRRRLPTADVADRFSVALLKEVVEILWGQDEARKTCRRRNPTRTATFPVRSVRRWPRTAASSSTPTSALPRYLIYQLTPQECRLIDIRRADGADEAEDSSAFRAGLIDDCHVLFVQSIGGPAAAKVINAGVYPLKYVDGGDARPHLNELRKKMGSLPPPWLAKAMNVPVEDRIRFHVEAEA